MYYVKKGLTIIMMNLINYQVLKKKRYNKKCNPKTLKLEDYGSDEWFTAEELDDEEKSDDMTPLEGDEKEVRKGKGRKILTSNKLLTRLPILLPQIKARHNS